MKKTLAVILSVIMLLGAMPFAGLAADTSYDRAAVASGDEAYIAEMSAEQMASVILDWVDREIAAYSAEIEDSIVNGVIENGGFDAFEASFLQQAVAEQINVASIDDIVGYKSYLTELGGDFAKLDATNLKTRTEAGSSLGFIYGVIQFMADNSDTFGKVFHWEEGKVFDYGKVGEYILSLDTTDPDNKKIVDFYNDYLIGNDIQEWFIAGVAKEMDYTIPTNEDGTRAETFDQTISNGIIAWFAGLCEKAGILSADGLATLKTYDLRKDDIYAHIKNFVALVQSDNKVKIDTYYNYLLDSVVRPLLKTMVGQKAEIGADAEVPASFAKAYTDLKYLAEISGGTVNYKDGDSYYQITITDGTAAAKALTWVDALDINLEPPVVNMYTGAALNELVQKYEPNNPEFTTAIYATAKNQSLMGDMVPAETFAGTEVPAEATAIMVDANAKALADGVKIETIMNGVTSALEISFAEIEEMVEAEALPVAQELLAEMTAGMTVPIIGGAVDITIEAIDVVIGYKGWATEDDFIAQATIDDVNVTLGGAHGSMAASFVDVDSLVEEQVATYIDNPVATIVVDGLTGGKYDLEAIEGLMDYIDTDFVIDSTIIDIAGNYDTYNGAIGQVNHILVGLVEMLVSDSGEADLALTDGGNTNLYANLEKIAKKSDEVIGLAKEFLSGEEIKAIFDSLDVDSLFASSHGLNLDMILGIDFSDVESMIVCGILVILDLIDDETAGSLVNDIHNAVEGLETLDAMAVAVADYAAAKYLPEINKTLGTAFEWKATEVKTVTDGAGEDILLDKAIALVYDIATWGVDVKMNELINKAITNINTEAGTDLPAVKFALGVAEGASWKETLTNLVNRVYELADGIIIACDNDYTDTIDKISAVFNAILPTEAMFSNCGSEDFAVDGNVVKGYLFKDALEGDFDGLLGMFETKEDAIAGDVSVPKALINSCQHIVDSIFPGTVVSSNYADALDVQETFTSGDSDVVIASNNMKSINNRKADLVPAVLNIVREAGTLLPYFAKCDKDHEALTDAEKDIIPGTPADCENAGVTDTVKCADCGYIVSGGEEIKALGHDYQEAIVDSTCTAEGTKTTTCSRCDYENVEKIEMKAHSYGAWAVKKAATCTAEGIEARKCACGKEETRAIAKLAHTYSEWKVVTESTCSVEGKEARKCACGYEETRAIAKADHTDDNDDNECDVCGKEINSSFGAKIKAFFQKIINWFKELFGIN